MKRSGSQAIWSIGILVLAAGLLAGCPKRPEVQAVQPVSPGAAGSEASSGAGAAGGGAVTQPGAGGAGAGGATAGGGAGAAGGGQTGAGEGGAAVAAGPATGTTIPALPSPGEFVETKDLTDIHFDFDKSDIREVDRAVLDANVAWLRQNAKVLVLVEGHCDERGTNEYNLALGERRAKATREYLESAGIDAARVTIISYGKERPLCTDSNEACWQKNRRAHFLIKQ